jgi:2'-5' RNA ligase
MFPLILTLKLDAASFQYFEALRHTHFPTQINHLAAHLTMFHHLPGEESAKIKDDLAETSRSTEVFPLRFPGWRFLGKGVAMNVESEELLKLRAHLADAWRERLVPQDRQKFQPHITVQNKVESAGGRRLYETLSSNFEPFGGAGEGLQLWHYLGAPWKLEEEFLFVS